MISNGSKLCDVGLSTIFKAARVNTTKGREANVELRGAL
jgi:hypothetical protein